jgi:hypothetical protein
MSCAPVIALIERYIRQHLRGRPHDARAAHNKCLRWSVGLTRFLRKHGRRPALYVMRQPWRLDDRPARSLEWVGSKQRRVRTVPPTLRSDGLHGLAFALNPLMYRHFLVFCDGYWIDLSIRQFESSIRAFQRAMASRPAPQPATTSKPSSTALWWKSEGIR